MASRAALTPGQAAERTKVLAQRAGAWNRHATEAVRANLELAIEKGEHRLRIDYGGLKILHDLQGGDGKPLGAVAKVEVVERSSSDMMDEDLADTDEPATESSAAAPGPTPEVQHLQPSGAADGAAAATAAARVAELEKRAATATARRRRQKAARKERDERARLLAAQTGAPTGGDAPQEQVHVPLWSTSMGQDAAMVRLLGEVTERCATEGGRRGVQTRAISVLYAGRTYSAAVLSGTVATTMMPGKCGGELLALLGSGLTEEGISTLLRRWSQPQQRSGFLGSTTAQPFASLMRPGPTGTHHQAAAGQAARAGGAAGETRDLRIPRRTDSPQDSFVFGRSGQ